MPDKSRPLPEILYLKDHKIPINEGLINGLINGLIRGLKNRLMRGTRFFGEN